MSGGMQLGPSDHWKPTARSLNDLRAASDYVKDQKSGGGALSAPRPRWELGTVVPIKNADEEEKDWPPFSPVVVTAPEGATASRAFGYAARPHLEGNQPTGSGVLLAPGDVIGITQEPIPFGKMGRVCIAGLSCALVRDQYETEENEIGQSYAQIAWDSENSRLVWERSVWGHARFLLRLDDDEYQDGTYNDQFFALIDLNPGPQRLWAKLETDLKGTTESGGQGYATAAIWTRPSKTDYWEEAVLNKGEEEETPITLTVYAPPFLGEDETIKAGNWVLLEFVYLDWLWYVVGTSGEVLTECTP